MPSVETKTKPCLVCQKPFIARNSRQVYCSALCRSRRRLSPQEPPQEKICIWCGRKFFALSARTKYCEPSCQQEAYLFRRRAAAGLPLPRPLEPDTRYLIHKWSREGMNSSWIASLLDRPLEQILQVLSTPLHLRQELLLQQFLKKQPAAVPCDPHSAPSPARQPPERLLS